jgi:hypothetical protein
MKSEVLASVDTASLNARRVLLAGETIFASLQPSVPDGFVQQVPRSATAGLAANFRKSAPKVYVSVDARLLDIPGVRFALAIDGYIAWGLRESRKGTMVFFGGVETEKATYINILVFSNGELVNIDEKVLPEKSESYFRDALLAIVSDIRLKFPTARFVQAALLENWQIDGIEYIGDKPIQRLSYRPLTKNYRQYSDLLFPGALVAVGMSFYVGIVSLGWNKYSQAVADYENALTDLAIKERGGVDSGFLDIMNARRIYMEAPRRQIELVNKVASIVRGIGAVPDVQVLEMKVPAPSINSQQQVGITIDPDLARKKQQIAADRAPDVWFSISVPKAQDSAINQARSVMVLIANSTGMSLRLAHQGWRDDQTRRIFNIEGFLHD